MKIALNITREPLAGITSTNLSLIEHLHSVDVEFIGIELNAFRNFESPVAYRHLQPEWFTHHIVSICDFPLNKIVKKSKSLKDVERHFRPIISTVREILRREKPDVMLISGTYYIPWIFSIAAQRENIPIVLWYAGVLSREVSGNTSNFQKIFRAMEKSIVRRADKIIFPSKLCQNIVLKEVLDSRTVRKGTVIPNPISPIFTRPSKIEQSVEKRIAFVGRYNRIKNLEGFCSLHKKLLKLGWKHEATIVSNISDKDMKKIPKTINVTPSVPIEEIQTFYVTQGLIISPSHFETFGNVPIEAVCLGIPALVNQTMGCSEVLLESGLEGMVVDFNDIETVLQRVQRLCGQHILPRQINNVRKRVDTEYVAYEIASILSNGTLARPTKKKMSRFWTPLSAISKRVVKTNK